MLSCREQQIALGNFGVGDWNWGVRAKYLENIDMT